MSRRLSAIRWYVAKVPSIFQCGDNINGAFPFGMLNCSIAFWAVYSPSYSPSTIDSYLLAAA